MGYHMQKTIRVPGFSFERYGGLKVFMTTKINAPIIKGGVKREGDAFTYASNLDIKSGLSINGLL